MGISIAICYHGALAATGAPPASSVSQTSANRLAGQARHGGDLQDKKRPAQKQARFFHARQEYLQNLKQCCSISCNRVLFNDTFRVDRVVIATLCPARGKQHDALFVGALPCSVRRH
jgi:hypothetical protein